MNCLKMNIIKLKCLQVKVLYLFFTPFSMFKISNLWRDSTVSMWSTPVHIILYCIILYCITLYYIISYYIILYYIILYYIILYCIILYYIILYYITLYYIVLYYITLYYIVLYYIILYYIMVCCLSSSFRPFHFSYDTGCLRTARLTWSFSYSPSCTLLPVPFFPYSPSRTLLFLLSFPYSPSNTGAERNIKEYARYGDSGPHLCPADG